MPFFLKNHSFFRFSDYHLMPAVVTGHCTMVISECSAEGM